MTTYVFFKELVEISTAEVGFEKYYNVKGFHIVDSIAVNAAKQMTEKSFWMFSERLGNGEF